MILDLDDRKSKVELELEDNQKNPEIIASLLKVKIFKI